ncbi:hypothetical protein [Microbacterium sp. MMO-10]|uniref:hypothetical protein n=1 Tax=Microbacterium sp. MMO-10 TaxID=3081272 RepID=UPI003019A35B
MNILANTGPAVGTIDDFISRYGYLNGTIEYRAVMPDLNGAASGNGRMGTYATGGRVVGPGTSTSDSVVARLSNGEYVLTADDVRKAGGPDQLDRWRTLMHSGNTPSSLAEAATQRYAAYAPTYTQAQQVHVTVTAPESSSTPSFVLEDHSTNYSYDPDQKAKAQREQLSRALAAHGLR